MDTEEYLSEFKRVEPAPALRERVLNAAKEEARRSWIDRLWTGKTWLAIAAALLVSVGLFLMWNAPTPAEKVALPKPSPSMTPKAADVMKDLLPKGK